MLGVENAPELGSFGCNVRLHALALRARYVEALTLLREAVLTNSFRFRVHLHVYLPTIFEATALGARTSCSPLWYVTVRITADICLR